MTKLREKFFRYGGGGIICDCFASDDHDDSAHRLEDVCQLGDDGGVE